MKKVNNKWLKQIIGSLTPFVTFLSSGFASQTDNISTSVSFFKSHLDELGIPSKYRQTMEDLITAVDKSVSTYFGGWDRHPLNDFLTTSHYVNRQYNGGDWLLHFLCSNDVGKVYTLRNKLEYNVECIITILYSIVCMTRDKGAIDILAFSLGAKKGDDAKNKMMHMHERDIWILLHEIQYNNVTIINHHQIRITLILMVQQQQQQLLLLNFHHWKLMVLIMVI